jgi:hypothetical protein
MQVASFRTDLGRVVSSRVEAYRDRALKQLYDITTSPANDGKIGARLDTVYLGMVGLDLQATREILQDLIGKKLVTKTPRNEYRLTSAGLQWVMSHASPDVLLAG